MFWKLKLHEGLCDGVNVQTEIWDVCAGLPVVSKSGSQPARQPAPSPCLWAFLVFFHRCYAGSWGHPFCPLCSDSSPEVVSAKESSFTYRVIHFWHGAVEEQVFQRLCDKEFCLCVTCRSMLADIRELFIWSKLSMAAVRILTSDSRLLRCELAACRHTWFSAFSDFFTSSQTGAW